MKRTTRIRICIAAALLIAAILASSILLSGEASPTLMELPGTSTLTIETGEASVFISEQPRHDMEITRHHARSLQIEENDNDIHISARGPGIIEITLPSWSRLPLISIRTTSGDIVIENAMADSLLLSTESGSMMITETSIGDVEADSTSGNVIMTDTEADKTTITTKSGFIRAIGAYGDLDAESESGNIYIVPVGSGRLTTETDDGNIEIIAGERSLMWNTAEGSVTIYGEIMPSSGGEENATVTAISSGGDISIAK